MNTVDPNFFEANIPEAFRARKMANAEAQNKMVEVLPYFLNVIKNSNMINNGNYLFLIVAIQLVSDPRFSLGPFFCIDYSNHIVNKRGKVFAGFNRNVEAA